MSDPYDAARPYYEAELAAGTERFLEPRRDTCPWCGSTDLSVRLRSMLDHGILAMTPASDGSAYREYVLTPKGRGLFPILVALRQWSEEFDDSPEEIDTIMIDRAKGRPVKKLELHAEDGRLLSLADITLKPRPAPRRRSA